MKDAQRKKDRLDFTFINHFHILQKTFVRMMINCLNVCYSSLSCDFFSEINLQFSAYIFSFVKIFIFMNQKYLIFKNESFFIN